MGRWVYISGLLELYASAFEFTVVNGKYKSKLPKLEEQFKVDDLASRAYAFNDEEKKYDPKIAYHCRIYSLPRIKDYIEESLSEFPTSGDIIDHHVIQSERVCSSQEGFWGLTKDQLLKKRYQKIIEERYRKTMGYSQPYNTIADELALTSPEINECEEVLVAIKENKKYSSTYEVIDAIDHMMRTLSKYGITLCDKSYIIWEDDYITDKKYMFESDGSESKIKVINKETNMLMATRTYRTQIIKDEPMRDELIVDEDSSWDIYVSQAKDQDQNL